MMGRRPIEGATILVEALELPMTPEEFHTELYGKLMDMFPDAKLMPGKSVSFVPMHMICDSQWWRYILSSCLCIFPVLCLIINSLRLDTYIGIYNYVYMYSQLK